MNSRKKAVFNWSGGKDSALALYKILQQDEYEIEALLTTINANSRRSSMHGIPVSLLQEQADSIGFPLYIVEIAEQSGMNGYEEAMRAAISHFQKQSVTHFIFGDIFLKDIKEYREKQLAPYGITVVEPLWGYSSREAMSEFLSSGLKTIVITTMADSLNHSFIGRTIDKQFIEDLPHHVDICGENGEYHTFCYAGSIFRRPVSFQIGEPLFKSFPVKKDDGTEQIYSYWTTHLESTPYKYKAE